MSQSAHKLTPQLGAMDTQTELLRIENLTLYRGQASVLDRVSLTLLKGRTLGLVGESGAGKSTLAMAIIGLLMAPEVQITGSMLYQGEELVGMPDKYFQRLRGKKIGLIFQDATTSLDPCFTIGQQICEPLRRHLGLNRTDATERAVELLDSVGIPDARARLNAYPHQLSGGMQQRVMISIALACHPDLLIADEPTSALDVTVQAQIMDLILQRVRATGASAVIVLHDLALTAQVCDDIAVMYAGQIVETGPAHTVLENPSHPYTKGLRACVVEFDSPELSPMPGTVPALKDMPAGCRFSSRCTYAQPQCMEARPELEWREDRWVACWQYDHIHTEAIT